MKFLLLAASALLVASCGSSDASDAQADPPVAADAPVDIVITQFPGAYFGRWGMTASDCADDLGDAEGILSMQGSLIKYGEAIATMTDGKRETINSMSAQFEVVGEGKKWTTNERFRLSKDRKQLTRQDLGTRIQNVYIRCPEQASAGGYGRGPVLGSPHA